MHNKVSGLVVSVVSENEKMQGELQLYLLRT